MIRASLLHIFLLGLALAASSRAAGAQEPPPRPPRASSGSGLHFAEPRHQFGPVVGLRHLYHTFSFRNPGALPVTITEVKISCSCTMAGIAVENESIALPASVPPGASGFLRLRATTEGIDGPKPVVITLRTDRGEEHLVLVLEGVPEFDLAPASIDFGQVAVGDEARATLRVSSHDGSPFSILDWGRPRLGAPAPARAENQSLEDYEQELERHDRREQLGLREKPSDLATSFRQISDSVVEVDFVYRPTGKLGKRSSLIRLVASGERSMHFGLSAMVEGAVYLSPAPSASLGGFPAGLAQTWEFFLVDRDPQRTTQVRQVLVHSALLDHLKVEVQSLPADGSRRRTRIVLHAAASLPLGILEGKLVVETDHPTFPKFETEFSAIAHGEKRRG